MKAPLKHFFSGSSKNRSYLFLWLFLSAFEFSLRLVLRPRLCLDCRVQLGFLFLVWVLCFTFGYQSVLLISSLLSVTRRRRRRRQLCATFYNTAVSRRIPTGSASSLHGQLCVTYTIAVSFDDLEELRQDRYFRWLHCSLFCGLRGYYRLLLLRLLHLPSIS